MRHPSNYKSEEAWAANNLDHSLILGKSGVVSARAGTKIKNGVDTGIPCIVIGVSEKKPVKDIAPEDLISEKLPGFSRELITDIIEVPEVKAISTCLYTTGACSPHGDKYRPLVGGISIGQAAKSGGLWLCGTGGLLVKDELDGSIVMLTNQHVSGDAGTNVSQPSVYDFGNFGDPSRNVFGSVKRARKPSGEDNVVDAAIITILEQAKTDILDIGVGPFRFADVIDVHEGSTEVFKSGRTTGFTESGLVADLACAVNVNYRSYTASFIHQIMITSSSRFIRAGDSGSALLADISNTDQVVGLLFASQDDGRVAYANHIRFVATALDIKSLDRVVTDHIEEIAFGSGFTLRLKQGISSADLAMAVSDPGSWQSFVGANTGINTYYLYVQLYDASGHAEIVKIVIPGSTAGNIIIERGQEGTTALAWPAGTPLVQVLSAATLAHFSQKPEYRTTLVNPNGVISSLYLGEKVWEDGADDCHKRWWISCEAESSYYWVPMNGTACSDEISIPRYGSDYPAIIINTDTTYVLDVDLRGEDEEPGGNPPNYETGYFLLFLPTSPDGGVFRGISQTVNLEDFPEYDFYRSVRWFDGAWLDAVYDGNEHIVVNIESKNDWEYTSPEWRKDRYSGPLLLDTWLPMELIDSEFHPIFPDWDILAVFTGDTFRGDGGKPLQIRFRLNTTGTD